MAFKETCMCPGTSAGEKSLGNNEFAIFFY